MDKKPKFEANKNEIALYQSFILIFITYNSNIACSSKWHLKNLLWNVLWNFGVPHEVKGRPLVLGLWPM